MKPHRWSLSLIKDLGRYRSCHVVRGGDNAIDCIIHYQKTAIRYCERIIFTNKEPLLTTAGLVNGTTHFLASADQPNRAGIFYIDGAPAKCNAFYSSNQYRAEGAVTHSLIECLGAQPYKLVAHFHAN